MTTAVPAPAAPSTPARPATPSAGPGLPAARTAEPDGCGTLLRIDAVWIDALPLGAVPGDPARGEAARRGARTTGDDLGRTAVLRIHGEIDLLTGGELGAALHAWLRCGAGTVVVDLRGVSFVDCAGVGLLVETRRRAERAGVRLRVVPGRVVARTAALLDLTAALGL